ncbi:MAG: hypothetical protein CL608_04830 [Anaerolineaceae bacterium]|nr:hypothetical protein [Anaerolineaceae bacterium]
METNWDLSKLQKYIDDEIEESLTLDYKAAGALQKSDGKKKEITKDVSAMANSAGGLLLYGISEYQQPDKEHLPEKFSPIDQTEYSKEWLEQVIMNIRPRIDGIIIHPVSVEENQVIYVVEIPQSTLAHQASDYRYYKRFNFLSVPMEDHEIRDVNNRATVPEVAVSFYSQPYFSDSDGLWLKPIAKVINKGHQVVNHFKLIFYFPNLNEIPPEEPGPSKQNTSIGKVKQMAPNPQRIKLLKQPKSYEVTCRSNGVLFPQDTDEVDSNIRYCIMVNEFSLIDMNLSIKWILYADNMPLKKGNVSLLKVHRNQRGKDE